MSLVIGIAVLLAAAPGTLSGAQQQAQQLVEYGEELARTGRVDDAIVRFKQAQAIYADPATDCFIGLGYSRKKSWPQAELFLQRCLQQAASSPPWSKKERKSVLQALAKGPFASVTIGSTPKGATVTCASFAAGETFHTPATVWLPLGSHQLILETPGFQPRIETISIADRNPRTLDFHLASIPEPPPRPPEPAQEPEPPSLPGTVLVPMPTSDDAPSDAVTPTPEPMAPPPKPRSPWLTVSVSLAVVSLVAAVTLHGLSFRTFEYVASHPQGTDTDKRLSTFALEQRAAQVLYGTSALALGAVIALW